MIKIDEAVLEKTELLAKLKIEPSQREKTIQEMEKLLAYTEKLNEVDTEGILPLSHGEPGVCTLREDVVSGANEKDGLFANAPEWREDYLVVPKTV